jgi:hypothetical protein
MGPIFPQMDSLELTVYYILAKGYTSSSLGVLGFPAFDINQYLLGFYMGNAEGGMSFVPFTRIQGLEPADTQVSRAPPTLTPPLGLPSFSGED